MMNFDNHDYAHEDIDGKIKSWHVPDLWKYTENFEVIDVPVESIIKTINMFINIFNADDWERVINADLSYPVIINDITGIADGCHRTVKAMFLGMDTIKAVRIVDFPEPKRIWNNWKDYDENP